MVIFPLSLFAQLYHVLNYPFFVDNPRSRPPTLTSNNCDPCIFITIPNVKPRISINNVKYKAKEDSNPGKARQILTGSGTVRELLRPINSEVPSSMGGNYYCEYCDKTFRDVLGIRKTHIKGAQHRQMKKEHFDKYRGWIPTFRDD